MPDIHIHRDHQLGLAKARKIAWQWAEEVEHKLQMDCTVIEGQTSDTVEFTRSGVSGRLIVAADHFDLEAKLGFLLGAFSKTIETEITKNLDAMLGAQASAPALAPASAPARGAKPAKVAKPAPARTAASAPAAAKKAAASKRAG